MGLEKRVTRLEARRAAPAPIARVEIITVRPGDPAPPCGPSWPGPGPAPIRQIVIHVPPPPAVGEGDS